MCPVLVLVLLLVPADSESTLSDNSTGLQFILAFPESIGFFHPVRSDNKVKITALFGNTKVNITSSEDNSTIRLEAGETHEYNVDADLELSRSNISNKTLQIMSSHLITVQVITLKVISIQTALVTPSDKLGTEYLVPPVPMINGTTHPADIITTTVTEKCPFKLIVINTDNENRVTFHGATSHTIALQPHQITQVWVQQEDELRAVEADQPVTVLFGHTCAMRKNCTCGQLFTTLPPTNKEEQTFFIPPALAKDAEEETFVLLSEKDSTNVKPFSPKSPLVRTTGSVILYRPGLLLRLTPETDFAACFVVNIVPDAQNFAVIVVHKDLTDGVHVGNHTLESPVWQELESTEYVSTTLVLTTPQNVIWHAYARFTVYFMGNRYGALFGNPASIISKNPDFRGCLLTPDIIEIGVVAGTWQESLMHCRENNLDLMVIPGARFQTQISQKIHLANSENLDKVWIGMRQSSQTLEWYWLSADQINYTNWGQGEPGMEQDGQCACMSLERSKDFEWSDEDCCKNAYPICYREPELFPL